MLQIEQPVAAQRVVRARSGWATVAVLFLFMALNFADKAVIGLVAVPMMREMGLSASQLGMVGSAFFLLFAVSAIGVGAIADRLDPTWLLAGLALVWVAAQVPMIWPASFATLLACRILLGAGEGPALPLAMHVTYEAFDDRQRSLPTLIVQLGATAGLVLAGPALTFVEQRWHWRATFLALGVAGVAWVALWLALRLAGGGRAQAQAPGGARPAAPTWRVLRAHFARPMVLCVLLQSFVGYAVVACGITWMPVYFRLGLGMPAARAGWLFGLQVLLQVPVGFALASLSHALLKRNVSTRLARGVLVSACCVAGGVLLCASLAAWPPLVKVALVGVACAFATQVFAFGPQLVAEVVPGASRAAMLSCVHALATTAGVFAPALMGRFVDAMPGARGFESGFGITGALLAVAGLAGFVWLRPAKEGQGAR
ncbi:MFS transporter [Paraburkholderia unamae]|uniref:Sugar phosphate permease n=1 Tax=Paraburkholderia unamae TaxID=219649 RepID=A0ABX5K611_9BURK|nr:MFS transporter [Paraburkholderia unamae]PVX60039.1 sugar phosphate permease [Paraburkholderia unamae]CAG9274329.1 Sugar phosphate permease [Paraburkholderia unamae]